MDASQLPVGKATEKSPVVNLPGVYRHPEGGMELITSSDFDHGVAQADAFVRVGYERVGDVPTREELLAIQKKQAAKDLAADKIAKAKEEEELKKLQEEMLAEAGLDKDGKPLEEAKAEEPKAESDKK